jgi:hypothetical protein
VSALTPSRRRTSRGGPSSSPPPSSTVAGRASAVGRLRPHPNTPADDPSFDLRSYLFELEQEIVTLRRELAARGGGEGPPSVLPGLGGAPPPQSASPSSLQAQYYSQEPGTSNQYSQGYAADDLPQGAIVQSPPYPNFYSHQPPPPDVKSEGQSQPPQQQQQQQQHSAYQPMMIDPSLQQNGYQPQGYSHARQSSSNGSMTPGASMGEASSSQSSGVPGRDIGSLLNGVGFAGHESGEQKFMGSSSGSASYTSPLLLVEDAQKLTFPPIWQSRLPGWSFRAL